MFFLYQHKSMLWTILSVTILASLYTIQRSFQLVEKCNGSNGSYSAWRMLENTQEPLAPMSKGPTLLRSRVDTLSMNNVSNDSHQQQLLLKQALEIEQMKIALEDARQKNLSPSLSASLRYLWQQLQNDTPTGTTNQKVLSHLKPRDRSTRNADDIVLVTHCSLFKLDTFLVQLQYWNGPTSLALYMNQLGGNTAATSGKDAIDLLDTFLRDNQEILKQTSIHLFMEYTNSERAKPLAYPHNPLRNLAMDNSDSDYILALDVDFIPNPPNCYDQLLSTLHAKDSSLAKELRIKKRLMVLPAFEVYASPNQTVATPDQLPTSKQALYQSVQSNLSETFRERRYPAGHGPTNFTRWFHSVAPANPKARADSYAGYSFYPIYYRPGFEPYVLAYRPGIPRYWNGFRGFGQNKLSWFQELHRAGYMFGSLWDFYVVHLQHPSTFDSKQRNSNVVKNEVFLTFLNEKYPLSKSRQKRVDKRYYFDFRNKKVWGSNSTASSSSSMNKLGVAPFKKAQKGKKKVSPKKKNYNSPRRKGSSTQTRKASATSRTGKIQKVDR